MKFSDVDRQSHSPKPGLFRGSSGDRVFTRKFLLVSVKGK